jgi:hypothetical protein
MFFCKDQDQTVERGTEMGPEGVCQTKAVLLLKSLKAFEEITKVNEATPVLTYQKMEKIAQEAIDMLKTNN